MASKHEHEHGSEGSSGSDGIDQYFFGSSVTGKTPLTLSTLMTELHVTQACLTAGTGPVIVKAATSKIEAPAAICVLSTAVPHALLDLSFFHGDESVTFTLHGAGSASAEVSLSGSVAVIGELPDDEDEEDDEEEDGEEEDEEDEEEEEEEDKPAPVEESKPLSAVEKLKRKREEAERAASSSADAAISKAAAERPSKQARREGKADAGAGAAAGGAGAAAPKAEKKDDKPKAAASGALQELANGNLKFTDTVVGSGPKASRGDKVTVR